MKKRNSVHLFAVALMASGCAEFGEEGLSSGEMGEELLGAASEALSMNCTLGASCASVSTLSKEGLLATYRVDMKGYRRLDLFANVCNPTGWTLHLTDSPSANGYGGDAATTDHDAEGYLLNNTFQFFSSWDMNRGLAGTRVTNGGAFAGGCRSVQMTAFHASGSAESTFRFNGDGENASASREIVSLHGMKIGYTACASATSAQRSIECDWENASLSDQNYWYIGINRVVRGDRRGTGVGTACVVLNSDVTVNPPSCL